MLEEEGEEEEEEGEEEEEMDDMPDTGGDQQNQGKQVDSVDICKVKTEVDVTSDVTNDVDSRRGLDRVDTDSVLDTQVIDRANTDITDISKDHGDAVIVSDSHVADSQYTDDRANDDVDVDDVVFGDVSRLDGSAPRAIQGSMWDGESDECVDEGEDMDTTPTARARELMKYIGWRPEKYKIATSTKEREQSYKTEILNIYTC